MDTKNVNSGNFKVEEIVFDDGEFSIAWGRWKENQSGSMAMRWNGEEDSIGYPNSHGKPQWFLLTDDLKDLLLSALLGAKASNKNCIIKILSKEK